MGGDGGTLNNSRDDHVRMRREILGGNPCHSRATDDLAERRKELFRLCTLSKYPLEPPNVVDGKGWLYNKEQVLEWILKQRIDKMLDDSSAPLDATADTGGSLSTKSKQQAFDHLLSRKSVMDVQLSFASFEPKLEHDAPSGSRNTDASAVFLDGQFMCTITKKEANGSRKFFVNVPCGCVLSESAISALKSKRRNCGIKEPLYCEVCAAELHSVLPRMELYPSSKAEQDAQLEKFEQVMNEVVAKPRKIKKTSRDELNDGSVNAEAGNIPKKRRVVEECESRSICSKPM